MEKLISAVEKNRTLILNAQKYIWENAETGYREKKTSEYMENMFTCLGYKIEKPEGITGFCAVFDTGRKGPEILIFGELDSLICHDHPDADKETGAVHCCGHSAQCAALLGIAAALVQKGVCDSLCGKVRLCAVPAEELIEIEYRQQLIKEGKITYMGGKTEFLKRGFFDSVDIAFMVHTTTSPAFAVRFNKEAGCICKRITYKGVSAHAGGAAWNGVNALYAANIGLSAVNAIRETFKDEDGVRVHHMITKGGSAVNAIPDTVIIESYVRALTTDAMQKANKNVNRALTGAALCIGANVNIEDSFGYAPLNNDENLSEIAFETLEKALPNVQKNKILSPSSACTDMGDISLLFPAIQMYAAGASGTSHGKDYKITDPDNACVNSAKWQVALLFMLLENGGKRAEKIIKEFKGVFKNKEEFFSFREKFTQNGDRIEYTNENAKIKL